MSVISRAGNVMLKIQGFTRSVQNLHVRGPQDWWGHESCTNVERVVQRSQQRNLEVQQFPLHP